MTLLDCRIKLDFEKLFIPILEITQCVFDLTYDNKHYRFKYPQEVSHVMPLLGPFTRERNILLLTVLLQTGKKYRKIAKGEINLYRKYFLTEQLNVEKWVYLQLYENQLEQMGHNTNILKAVTNTGKIYMKAQLLDPLMEEERAKGGMYDNISIFTTTTQASAFNKILKNNLKQLLSTKDKAYANKTERFRSVTENGNEFLKNLKRGNISAADELYEDIPEEEEDAILKPTAEFNDGLSDISISFIEEEGDNYLQMNKMNLEIDSMISKMKIVFDANSEKLLPQDPIKLRQFTIDMTNSVKTIAANYTNNLHCLNEINNRLKAQGKEYYEKYKNIKRTLKEERKTLQENEKKLEKEMQNNTENNQKLKTELNELQSELGYVRKTLGADKDEDIDIMISIINSLDINKFDLTECLNEEEKKIFENMIGINPNSHPAEEEIDDEKIIEQIEEIVNINFEKGLIEIIKIDQENVNTYSFNDKSCTLYFDEKDSLRIKGENVSFNDWILSNFGVKPIEEVKVPSDKKITNSQSNPSNKKKVEDKKSPIAKKSNHRYDHSIGNQKK